MAELTKKDLGSVNTEVKNSLIDFIERNQNDGLDISQESITAAKYALAGLADNTSSLRGTTNLNPQKVKAISRMLILNKFYKTPLVDDYADMILEMNRSVTKEPTSFLNIVGNLFRNEGTEKQGMMGRIFSGGRRT